ncbi:hypothetical protein [Anaerosolibacter sp.]|uniref:hypothetical protein n=1 Tax=Anaerosolibacter sp. TaxID=1872527 RepID=UPI0039EE11EA
MKTKLLKYCLILSILMNILLGYRIYVERKNVYYVTEASYRNFYNHVHMTSNRLEYYLREKDPAMLIRAKDAAMTSILAASPLNSHFHLDNMGQFPTYIDLLMSPIVFNNHEGLDYEKLNARTRNFLKAIPYELPKDKKTITKIYRMIEDLLSDK